MVLPGAASAQAWTQPRGHGEVIVKAESMRADEAYDIDGSVQPLLGPQRDDALAVFAQYGLTDAVTLRFKGEWQSGEDFFGSYEGQGPVEIGVAWRAYRDDRTAASLYVGYADGGDGKNALNAAPGQGEYDWEVRGAVGRSFEGRRWLPPGFAELQLARRFRQGLPDETRADATVGLHLTDDWLFLSQGYAGETQSGARWLSSEISLVRRFGAWRVQGGWRQTVDGVDTPRNSGPVVAVWRAF